MLARKKVLVNIAELLRNYYLNKAGEMLMVFALKLPSEFAAPLATMPILTNKSLTAPSVDLVIFMSLVKKTIFVEPSFVLIVILSLSKEIISPTNALPRENPAILPAPAALAPRKFAPVKEPRLFLA